MPMFLSEEEYESCSHDASLVAEKADAFIRELYNQLEKYKAQTRSGGLPLLPHQIYLKNTDQKDGEIIERLSTEASELRALLERKNSEISEKNAAINGYLDEMETLTCSAALKEVRLKEIELELAQSRASCTRPSQGLSSSKDAAVVANQERNLSTSNTLAGLYKVLKDSNERRLEGQKSAREEFEKEAACLKEKLKKEYEAEVEKNKDLKEKLKKFEAEVEKNKEKLEKHEAEIEKNQETLEKHEAGVETNTSTQSGVKRPVDWDPKKIFVGGIPRTVTDDKFKEFFSAYGTVVWHEIIRDHDSRLPRGFGFVVFDSAQVVDYILINGNYIDMEGAKVEIKRAQPKEKPAPAPAPGPSYGSLPGFSGGYNRVVPFRHGGFVCRLEMEAS